LNGSGINVLVSVFQEIPSREKLWYYYMLDGGFKASNCDTYGFEDDSIKLEDIPSVGKTHSGRNIAEWNALIPL
jgi:hypothetical protein